MTEWQRRDSDPNPLSSKDFVSMMVAVRRDRGFEKGGWGPEGLGIVTDTVHLKCSEKCYPLNEDLTLFGKIP